MVQIKKPEVREAILEAAEVLFREQTYAQATMSRIAKKAGISTANLYVYFSSKFEILFAVYDSWHKDRINRMVATAATLGETEESLRFVLRTLWCDIPADDNCFANNLIQALSNVSLDEEYSRDLLLWTEQQLTAALKCALPETRYWLLENGGLPRLLMMAFDGFVVGQRVTGPREKVDRVINTTVDMMLGRRC